jgi:starch-binding outer membrane protein, SusD/RagB family
MQKYHILGGLLLAIACFGCNKQLNLLPSDSISPDKAFANVADLQQGLEGAYEENIGAYNKIYIGSILADEAKVGPNNGGNGLMSFEWQYTANDALAQTEWLSDFAAYYSMIDAINKELASIGNVAPKNNDETALKNRIDGTLIALRGIAHFELLIRFMSAGYDPNSPGIPIMLQSDLLGKPARARAGDVIAQIKKDLATGRADRAIPDGPDDLTWLSQAAIAAYQARVSMLTGREWDSVTLYARQALTLSGKTLASDSNFVKYWSEDNDLETIWKYTAQTSPQALWISGGAAIFGASDKLIGKFDRTNDIRYGIYFRPSVDLSNDTSFIINKYPGSPDDIKLVRLSEIYLDLAEGYAHQTALTGYLDSAGLYLHLLRDARLHTNPPITFASQQSAIQTVLDERFKELCFEGFRFFDLKRNSLAVNRNASDVQDTIWQNLPATDHHFALPIPQHEIFANPNMKQNPGY